MLHEYAHYVEGTGQKSVSVEAGLMDMLDRMKTGRFKVFKHLTTGGRSSGSTIARTARWSKRATT